MNIKKIAWVIAIVLIIVLAFNDFKDADNKTESDKPTNEDVKREPGFEAVFVVIALFAAKYIITRHKEKRQFRR
ncbi:MAG: hypothetical protein KAQ87_03160 [Candidatus Pacebacteria bacterium]|nr:hypothetical protein [Candidatus Paceibacterota bacterium]